jgi:aldehyde dehydrogenase
MGAFHDRTGIGVPPCAGQAEGPLRQLLGGKFVEPLRGLYTTDKSPIDSTALAEFAQSSTEDVDRALDAAHAARDAWARSPRRNGRASSTRSRPHWRRIWSFWRPSRPWTHGKPIRETINAVYSPVDRSLPVFRGCVAGREGRISIIDDKTVAYHFKEPIGVVGQIIPWTFPC